MDDSQHSVRSPDWSTVDSFNTACFLHDSDDDSKLPRDISTILVPETPSPLTHRRKRHCQNHEDNTVAAPSCSGGRNSEKQEIIPGYLSTTPGSKRTLKRRKVDEVPTSSLYSSTNAPQGHHHHHNTPQANGFVMASTFIPSRFPWLESPCPSASSTAGSFALDPASDLLSVNEQLNQKILKSSNTREQRAKKTRTRSSRSSAAPGPLSTRDLLGSVKQAEGGMTWPGFPSEEDVLIIEDDADDVLRSVQMAEDEAYARSLQEQFDLEERLDQQQRLQSRPSSAQSHPMVGPYVGMSWIPPWASMISSSSFPHSSSDLSVLQDLLHEDDPPRRQRRQQSGRSRITRRRQGSHAQMDMFDDSQGNNYEALLAFEEQQGSVVSKNPLTKAQIEQLPIKTYNPAHSAGKTDCQICFSEYKAGERLRMLPCLHDYHVKCIDRWLKENATCPICRADITACDGFS
ncbi:hypothetical protein DNTS_015249 [Danionella cerebrum]|uniref:RING-type domain-containing protein n=1 Tax=Danionella cerebrum TaxID=2873325 RepID=A0A553MSG9_9TELE|nr:hypothetical protein DNTS_015249 [Danionella translucida]TRY56120.1 hypothetical protein DNTS_015249 [Danionella translucida]